jgi:hypothetical protein
MKEVKWFYRKSELPENILIDEQTIIFSCDSSLNGTKKFSYLPIEQMPLFLSLLKENRHIYEIVPENRPVKMYFDLDMKTNDNPNDVLKTFLTLIKLETLKVFNHKLEKIVILDSCRAGKVSFHIVINDNIYFKNTQVQKDWIRYLQMRMKEEDILLWANEKGDLNYFVDEKVYSNFQNFRCVNQSKKGKENILQNIDNVPIEETLIRLYDVTDRILLNCDNINVKETKIIKIKTKSNKTASTKQISTDNFCTIGKTLRDQLTDDQFFSLPTYKRYLSMIPVQEDYDNWLHVGMAIKGCNGTEEDFVEWSKMGTKYVEGECKKFNTFTKGFNIYSLRRWAKLCNPEFFNGIEEMLHDYFNYNTQNMTINEVDSKYIQKDHILQASSKMIILHAFMGFGKTTSIKGFLEELKYERVLFLSPRTSFAYFISNDMGIENYIKLKDLDSADKLVVQLESLHKITNTKFDCVILDESESILKQFSSSTMDNKYLSTYVALDEIIKYSKKVILADAYITRRSVEFAEEYGNITLIRSKVKPQKRRAIEIPQETFTDHLIHNLKNDNKIYACYSEKKDLLSFQNDLWEKGIEKKDTIFYHADINNQETLEDANEHWSKYSLVATSPSITVGCSFSIADYFDYCYINGKASWTARDSLQCIMRVRHLKENIIYFCRMTDKQKNIKKGQAHKSFMYFDDYNAFQKHKKQMLMKIETDNETLKNRLHTMMCECTPRGLQKILYFNLFEDVMSKKHYNELLIEFFKRSNYDIEPLDAMENKNPCEKALSTGDYNLIEDISGNEVAELEKLIKNRSISFNQKLQYDKYLFRKFINDESHERIGDLFFGVFRESHLNTIFFNVYHEKNNAWDKVLLKDFEKSDSVLECNKLIGMQLKYIHEINKRLGLRHSLDTETIVLRDKVEKIKDWILTERENIIMAFNLNDYVKKINEEDKYKITQQLIKKIYYKWSLSNFKVLSKDRDKIATSFTIENNSPLGFCYDVIKKTEKLDLLVSLFST